jgi:hypothetical protein
LSFPVIAKKHGHRAELAKIAPALLEALPVGTLVPATVGFEWALNGLWAMMLTTPRKPNSRLGEDKRGINANVCVSVAAKRNQRGNLISPQNSEGDHRPALVTIAAFGASNGYAIQIP